MHVFCNIVHLDIVYIRTAFFLGIFLGFSILQILQSLAAAMCLAKKLIIKPKSTTNNGEDRVNDVDGSRKRTTRDVIYVT